MLSEKIMVSYERRMRLTVMV